MCHQYLPCPDIWMMIWQRTSSMFMWNVPIDTKTVYVWNAHVWYKIFLYNMPYWVLSACISRLLIYLFNRLILKHSSVSLVACDIDAFWDSSFSFSNFSLLLQAKLSQTRCRVGCYPSGCQEWCCGWNGIDIPVIPLWNDPQKFQRWARITRIPSAFWSYQW